MNRNRLCSACLHVFKYNDAEWQTEDIPLHFIKYRVNIT